MKTNTILVVGLLLLISVIFYWVSVRPSMIRSSCYKTVYAPRPHENDYEWAEGKMWLPKPESSITSHESYVWIYPDKATSTRYADEYGRVRESNLQGMYNDCMLREGIKP